MGAVHVTVTIRNPAEPSRSWEGLFLVDTGATDSLVPRSHLEAIGLESKGLRVYETGDGRKVKMDVTTADIEFMGDFTAGRILMGDDDAEPLLGVTALESAGIEVDPVNRHLKKLPALRLKRVATRFIGVLQFPMLLSEYLPQPRTLTQARFSLARANRTPR